MHKSSDIHTPFLCMFSAFCTATILFLIFIYILYLFFITEKSGRLRMATYRDGVKRNKGDKIGNSHIVCMCIIMRRFEISLLN